MLFGTVYTLLTTTPKPHKIPSLIGGWDDGQCICATQLKVNDRMPHDARPWIAATSQNKEEQPAGNKHTQYGV